MERPSWPSCERNKGPILEELKRVFNKRTSCLEIGTGTGQHAHYFIDSFPSLTWTCSDVESYHTGIKQWIDEKERIFGPVPFEVGKDAFPKGKFDCIYSANTLHIMPWKTVKTFIKILGKNCVANTIVVFYGPFNYRGEFTCESNKNFDRMLKEKNPSQGIRNFEDVVNNMAKNGFFLSEDVEMPANNRLLVFNN